MRGGPRPRGMRRFEIVFRPQAEADLFELYRRVAVDAGHEVAGSYIDRIEAACLALETFPKRGRARDDIRSGLRTMGFERRATIVFRVMRTKMVIVQVFHGGQDYERVLRLDTEQDGKRG